MPLARARHNPDADVGLQLAAPAEQQGAGCASGNMDASKTIPDPDPAEDAVLGRLWPTYEGGTIGVYRLTSRSKRASLLAISNSSFWNHKSVQSATASAGGMALSAVSVSQATNSVRHETLRLEGVASLTSTAAITAAALAGSMLSAPRESAFVSSIELRCPKLSCKDPNETKSGFAVGNGNKDFFRSEVM